MFISTGQYTLPVLPTESPYTGHRYYGKYHIGVAIDRLGWRQNAEVTGPDAAPKRHLERGYPLIPPFTPKRADNRKTIK